MEEKDEIDLDKNENENEIKNISNKEEQYEEEDDNKERTVTIQIDPTPRLMSLEEKLKLDVPYNITSEKIDESMDLDILIYNIKDFLIMFILLLSSSFNFNYLYLPFIFIGIFYYCLILENKSNKRNIKFILEIIVFIYSFLLLIFKIVSLILISKGNEYYLENRDIFIDLGISYLLSDKEKIYFISTFIGESLTFLFSLAAIIISKVTVITDEEIENRYFKKLTFDILFTIMRKYLYTCFFIISGIAVFNKSILSVIYIMPLCLLLFLYSIEVDRTALYNLFRIIIIILLFLLIFEILIINFTNFYSIAHRYFFTEDEENNFLLIWHQLGFYFAYYKENEYGLIFGNWLGYLFSCLSLTTFSLCSKAISKHELQIAKKTDSNKEEDKDKKENFFNILYDKLAEILLNPYYILHVCRVMAIIWIYIFRNFYSLGIFVWLFFSFVYLHITSNDFWTKYLLIPSLIISLFSIHISRIKGVFENLDEEEKYFVFALGKYEYDYFRYILGIFFYFFSTYFIYTLNEYRKVIIHLSPLPKFEEKNIVNNLINNEERNISLQEINITPTPNTDNIFYTPMNLEVGPTIENKIVFNKDLENINIDEDENLKEEDLSKITLSNIIKKNFFENIDKITLISIYLVISKDINIINLIILSFFILQLLFQEITRMISIGIIPFFQFLYLIEYIMDLIKVYKYETFKENIETIKFYLPFNVELKETAIGIFFYFIVYCLYVNYQFYNFKEYQELVDNEKINLKQYISIKFINYPILKSFLFLIGIIIINMYVWIIVLLFIFCTCYFEVNLIFGIKLGLFLISLYFLMLFIQDPKNKKLTLKSSIIVLIYCGINTLAVYIYQLLYLIIFKKYIDAPDNFFISNLPNIGFSKYEDVQLYEKLFPHFLSNFLSALFVAEMKRTIKDNEKHILQTYIKEKKTLSNNQNKKENDDEKDKEKENEEKESAAKKYQKNLEKMDILEIKNFFFQIIMVITQFYWLFLFMTVCILFTTQYLSYGMIIYLIIFGLTFICTFYIIVKNLSNFINKDSYFISKVIRYSLIEVKSHIKQNSYSRKIAFQFLFGINCIFLFIFYLSAIFYLFENGCNPEYYYRM